MASTQHRHYDDEANGLREGGGAMTRGGNNNNNNKVRGKGQGQDVVEEEKQWREMSDRLDDLLARASSLQPPPPPLAPSASSSSSSSASVAGASSSVTTSEAVARELGGALNELLEKVDDQLHQHTSRHYHQLMTLHRILHQSHQLHFKALPSKVDSLDSAIKKVESLVASRCSLLRSQLSHRHSLHTRTALLDGFVEAHQLLEEMEALSGSHHRDDAFTIPTMDESTTTNIGVVVIRITSLYQRYMKLVKLQPAYSTLASTTTPTPTPASTTRLPIFNMLSSRVDRVKSFVLQHLDVMLRQFVASMVTTTAPTPTATTTTTTTPTLSPPSPVLSASPLSSVSSSGVVSLRDILEGYDALGAHDHIEALLLTESPTHILHRLLGGNTSGVAAAVTLSELLQEVLRVVKPMLYAFQEASYNINPDPKSGFNWVTRGVWVPIASQLLAAASAGSSSISMNNVSSSSTTSPWAVSFGNLFDSTRDPDHFHQNYVAMLEWIEQLELLCPDDKHVAYFRDHSTFTTFAKRWNLDFYFLSRRRKWTTMIDAQLSSGTNDNALRETLSAAKGDQKEEGKDWWKLRLSPTECIREALRECWDPTKSLLAPLAHRHLNLSLQMISRLSKWISTTTHIVGGAATGGGGDATTATMYSNSDQLQTALILFHDLTVLRSYCGSSNGDGAQQQHQRLLDLAQESMPKSCAPEQWLPLVHASLQVALDDVLLQHRTVALPIIAATIAECCIGRSNLIATIAATADAGSSASDGSGGLGSGADLAGGVRDIGTFYRLQEQPTPTKPMAYSSHLMRPLIFIIHQTTITHHSPRATETLPSLFSFPLPILHELLQATAAKVAAVYKDAAASFIASSTQFAEFYKGRKNLNLDKMMKQLLLDVVEFGRGIELAYKAAATAGGDVSSSPSTAASAIDLSAIRDYQELLSLVQAEVEKTKQER